MSFERHSGDEPGGALMEVAVDWLLRQQDGALSDDERKVFDAWLAADPSHLQAYCRAQALWRDLDAVAMEKKKGASGTFRLGWGGSWRKVAAILLVLGLSAAAAPEVWLRLTADAVTATGEIRQLTLADGSRVYLDTASAVAFESDAGSRRLRLLRGAAMVEVQADPARRFEVAAGGIYAEARGTVYEVRLDGEDHGHVTVIESRVGVGFRPGGPARELAAGQRLYFDGAARRLAPVVAVDRDAAVAWVRGSFVFDDRPLGDVIAEINRYHWGRIQLADPALAGRRVSGVVDLSDPVAAVETLGRGLGLSITRYGGIFIRIG